jgi:hypothetical protein
MNFKNGREIKENDPVVGIDWRGGVIRGTAIVGDKKKAQPPFILLSSFKTVCPSLVLTQFLHQDEAVVNEEGICTVTAKPAEATAAA